MRTPNYRLGKWGNRRFNKPVMIHKPTKKGTAPPPTFYILAANGVIISGASPTKLTHGVYNG